MGFLRLSDTIAQWLVFGKLELWHLDDLHRSLRHGWQLLAVVVFCHHLLQFIELRSSQSPFIDRGIVIVAGYVWLETRRVGTCPMAEAGSAVGHIEREADAFAQHLVHSFYHTLGRTGFVACSPLVEPTAPEL